jgi:hypothetical protein
MEKKKNGGCEIMQVSFEYGALGKTLKEQADRQGVVIKDVEFLQRLLNSLTLVSFHLLTDSQFKIAMSKFHKKVIKNTFVKESVEEVNDV